MLISPHTTHKHSFESNSKHYKTLTLFKPLKLTRNTRYELAHSTWQTWKRRMLCFVLTSVNRFLYWTLSPGASCSQAFIKASTDSSSFSGKNDRKHCSKSARASVPWKNTAFISLNFLSTIPSVADSRKFLISCEGNSPEQFYTKCLEGYEESWCWTQYNIIQNSWVRFPTKVKRIRFPYVVHNSV